MAKQTLSVLQSPADPEEAFTAALLHRSTLLSDETALSAI